MHCFLYHHIVVPELHSAACNATRLTGSRCVCQLLDDGMRYMQYRHLFRCVDPLLTSLAWSTLVR